MKSYLLDTHTALWWAAGSPRLSEPAKDIIKSKENQNLLECCLRLGGIHQIGSGEDATARQAQRSSFTVLPIHLTHAAGVHSLPAIHRDPFDRLLISQAITEDLILISDDQVFKSYSVPGLVF